MIDIKFNDSQEYYSKQQLRPVEMPTYSPNDPIAPRSLNGCVLTAVEGVQGVQKVLVATHLDIENLLNQIEELKKRIEFLESRHDYE